MKRPFFIYAKFLPRKLISVLLADDIYIYTTLTTIFIYSNLALVSQNWIFLIFFKKSVW